jgi:hypothetical protein
MVRASSSWDARTAASPCGQLPQQIPLESILHENKRKCGMTTVINPSFPPWHHENFPLDLPFDLILKGSNGPKVESPQFLE